MTIEWMNESLKSILTSFVINENVLDQLHNVIQTVVQDSSINLLNTI